MTDDQRALYLRALAKHGLESRAAEAADILVPDAERLRAIDQRFADQCSHAMVAAIDEVEAKLRELALKGASQGADKPRKHDPRYMQMYLAAKRPAYSPARHARLAGTKAKKDESPDAIRAKLDSMSDEELLGRLPE